jgi:tetratricopeptide (TPR) repeat protein
MPSWLQGLDEEKAPVAESVVPAQEAVDESDWMTKIEEPVAESALVAGDEDVPSWLKGIDEESSVVSIGLPQDDLPAWMRDETGEVVAEPTKIEPTRATDWHPIDEKRPEPPAPVVPEEPKPVAPVQEKPKPAPVKKAAPKPAEPKPTPPAPYREPLTQRGTGMLTMPVDPILDVARIELSRSNIPGALETYAKLIKKGRFLDETIFDLREALYRYPVEVSIWQSLGDAYMRANRLQDALDAYTKAEELLR